MYRTSDQNKPSISEPTPEASKSADEGPSTPIKVENIPAEDLLAQIAESKRMAWGGQEPSAAGTTAQADPPQQQPSEKPAQKTASDLSVDELEAELARRRNAATSGK